MKRSLIALAMLAAGISAAQAQTIVKIGASFAPMAINESAVPKPNAAPVASSNGFSETPCENSGPLVKKAPIIASAQPAADPADKRSPPISAKLIGRRVESELIGETTPIFPVESPA